MSGSLTISMSGVPARLKSMPLRRLEVRALGHVLLEMDAREAHDSCRDCAMLFCASFGYAKSCSGTAPPMQIGWSNCVIW